MQSMLFMPSTPLNVLISATVALQFPQAEKRLWLIDQKRCQNNPYYQALLAWKDAPFVEVQLFCAEAKGLKEKMRERRRNFAALQAGVEAAQPDIIAVGSDRRVEFQFAMHCLQQLGLNPKGIYLDDGLYSYAGRASSLYKDGLNSLLKKLAYGVWWEEPSTVGASSLIEEVWLFKPDQAVAALQEKVRVELQSEWFKDARLAAFSLTVAEVLEVDIQHLSELDLLVMVPHPNNLAKMPGRAEQIQAYVKAQRALGKRIGVKYHPRTASEDSLHLLDAGAETLLPAQLAFEFALPVLKAGCAVVADVGTVLLTTKWLRPDLLSVAILDEQDGFQQRFASLFRAMGIPVVNGYDAMAGLLGQKCESAQEAM
ncbi:hypothetical protein [Thiomicrorhabdus cannonii]|uniref:hypothetical protein n=1 Tax=Thiomicrorhabdus cannonii TaxID=2748011 RepID=UPI0015B88785|nr:hypothetical protein [Thiomicrorhabdus cannonii]